MTLVGMVQAGRVDRQRAPSTTRLAGIDLARGWAVFGMFAAHVGPDPADGGVIGWLMELSHGRSAALFATLAGLSLAIMTGPTQATTGQKERQAATRIVIRALILLLAGTALTLTGTAVQVILAYYGLYFLLALPFTRLTARPLASIAAAWAVAGPLLSFAIRATIDGDLPPNRDPLVTIGGEGIPQLLLTGTYPAMTWMPFILAGMALGRLDLTAATTRVQLAITGPALAVLGYGGSWLMLRVLGGGDTVIDRAAAGSGTQSLGNVLDTAALESGTVSTDTPTWLLVASPHSGTPFEVIGALGVAIAVLAGALVLAEKLPHLLYPAIAVGTMSLTAYVGHVIAVDLLGIAELPGSPLPVLLGFIAAAAAFAMIWSRFFHRGPLEFLLHAATRPARWIR